MWKVTTPLPVPKTTFCARPSRRGHPASNPHVHVHRRLQPARPAGVRRRSRNSSSNYPVLFTLRPCALRVHRSRSGQTAHVAAGNCTTPPHKCQRHIARTPGFPAAPSRQVRPHPYRPGFTVACHVRAPLLHPAACPGRPGRCAIAPLRARSSARHCFWHIRSGWTRTRGSGHCPGPRTICRCKRPPVGCDFSVHDASRRLRRS